MKNLAQVQQDLRPYAIGKSTQALIKQAQNNLTLRVRDEKDIKKVLRMAMLMVGLRGTNMPTDEEKFVLLNFVRNSFGNQTPEEILIAFEMAVAGKLEVDSKCYENFSCEYFGRIMKAYIEWSRNEMRTAKIDEPEIVNPKPTDEESKALTIAIVNSYVKRIDLAELNGVDFEWTIGGLSHLYDDLVRFGIWICPDAEREQIKARLRLKFTDDKLFNAECKAEAYKLFCHTLSDMDMKLDENGEII